MTAWFEQLSDREKTLITIMGGLAIILLLMLAIVRPITNFHASAMANLTNEQTTALFVERAVANAASNGAAYSGNETTTSLSASQLRRVISTEARRAGLRQGGISNNEDQSVTVSFTRVPAGELLNWLSQMQESKGIIVREGRISKGRNGDAVDATLTFTQAKD